MNKLVDKNMNILNIGDYVEYYLTGTKLTYFGYVGSYSLFADGNECELILNIKYTLKPKLSLLIKTYPVLVYSKKYDDYFKYETLLKMDDTTDIYKQLTLLRLQENDQSDG